MTDDFRDIAMPLGESKTERQFRLRLAAQAAVEQLDKEGNYFRNLTKPRGLTFMLGSFVVFTTFLFFGAPLLRGVSFDGTIYGAALTAVVMLTSGTPFTYMCMAGVRSGLLRFATGKKNSWLTTVSMLGLNCIVPLELKIATIYPGHLALHGFLAWALLWFTFVATNSVYSKIANFVWPQVKTQGDEKNK
jgi:hypothetical protein